MGREHGLRLKRGVIFLIVGTILQLLLLGGAALTNAVTGNIVFVVLYLFFAVYAYGFLVEWVQKKIR